MRPDLTFEVEGFSSMVDSPPSGVWQPGDLLLCGNARVEPNGLATVRNGNCFLYQTALGVTTNKCYGLERLPGGNWLAFFGTAAYYGSDLGTWTQIVTGLTEEPWSIVPMTVGGTTYLYAANGASTTFYRFNGTGFTNQTAPAAIAYLAVHGDRLWGIPAGGSTIYASAVGDPSTWTSGAGGLSLPVNTHDGDVCTGIASAGDHLVVGKKQSVARIDGFGQASVIVSAGARGIPGGADGVMSHRTMVRTPQGLAWLSRRGIVLYSQGEIVNVTKPIQKLIGRIAYPGLVVTGLGNPLFDPLRWWNGCYNAHTNEISVAVTTSTTLTTFNEVTTRIIVNVQTGACFYYTHTGTIYAQAYHAGALTISAGGGTTFAFNGIVAGNGTGFVKAMEASVAHKDEMTDTLSGGTAYEAVIWLAPTTFGSPRLRKWLRKVTFWFVGSGTTSVTVTVDGDVNRDTTIASGSSSSAVVSFTSTTPPQSAVFRPSCRGHSHAVKFAHTPTAAGLFSLYSVSLDAVSQVMATR